MWLKDIFAGGAEGIFKGVSDLIKNFKGDPLELAKISAELEKAQQTLTLGLSQAQTRINEIEAASTDKFTSRWRPAIGWICGAAYAYNFVIQPFLLFTVALAGIHIPTPPTLDWTEMGVVLMGMLGLGAMRSYDKNSARNGS
jgi:hypothetical protein